MLLTELGRLGFRNKRIQYQIYKTIRTRSEELEGASLESLINLAVSVAYLS